MTSMSWRGGKKIKQKLDKNGKTKWGKGVTHFRSAVLSGVRGDRRSTETGISSKRGLILHQVPQAVKTFNSRQNSMENTGLIKETETEEQMR